MRNINARNARDQFSALLDQAEGGETITIERHGRPVARLVPIQPKGRRGFPSLAKFRASIKVKGKPLSQEVIEARDEERY